MNKQVLNNAVLIAGIKAYGAYFLKLITTKTISNFCTDEAMSNDGKFYTPLVR